MGAKPKTEHHSSLIGARINVQMVSHGYASVFMWFQNKAEYNTGWI